MSIFSGIINEYPKIAVDNFNPLVSTYFLSHLHLDHINGIENFLPNSITEIYASEITVKLIIGRYSEFKYIIPYLKGLKLKKSYTIEIKNVIGDQNLISTENINVLLIPSGHCLGSVMFLIKGTDWQILYTGDFRYRVGFATEIMKEYKIDYLDALYIDTTFMNKTCVHIPSREESLIAILGIIEKLLLETSDSIIYIDYKVRYTIEVLYHLIYLKFNIKVHVDWNYFDQLSKLDESFSYCMDPCNIRTRIHACYDDIHCKKQFEKSKSNNKLFTIIPSTFWWSERNMTNNKLIHWVDKYTIRVCFSHHSSCSEIMDLISTIPTKTIHDCVNQCYFSSKRLLKYFSI